MAITSAMRYQEFIQRIDIWVFLASCEPCDSVKLIFQLTFCLYKDVKMVSTVGFFD